MKYHRIIVTEESMIIAGLKAIIDIVEYIGELDEVSWIDVSIRNEQSKIVSVDVYVEAYEVIDKELLNNLYVKLQNKPLKYRIDIRLVDKQERTTLFSEKIMNLYDEIMNLSRNILVKLLRQYLNRNQEYFAAIVGDGKLILLEGEEQEVHVPIPQYLEPIVTAHTHPYSTCIPSKKDVESFIRLLMDQGIGSIIVSPLCTMLLYRRGPFVEEDYERLVRFSKEIGKAKDIVNALRIIGEYAKKLRNVKIITM